MRVLTKFKSQSLTKLINQERDKLCHFDTKGFLKSLVSDIYYPSPKSFVLLILLFPILFALTHLENIFLWFGLDILTTIEFQTLSQEKNHYQNLIAIHAGIGAIIFALVIFVAESMRDDEANDRARVLLKESYLFPLTVTEIIVFLIFIWGDINIWSVFPVIAIGFFTTLSLYRMIRVLLSKYQFAQKRAELLKERLQQSIDLAINERIGNTILLSKLNGKGIKLEFVRSPIEKQSEYYFFNANKFGIVSDIDMSALYEFAEIVESDARQNGYSFGGEGKPEVRVSEEGDADETETRTLHKNNRRYLLKMFHDVVNEEYRALICIDKKILQDSQNLDELESLVRKAIVIKPENNFAEEVRHEISGVKDQFISAISDNRLGKVEELADLYKKLAEGFLEYISKCGGGYSSEQARKERHSFLAGWKQVRWLSSDIRVLFEKAIESKDRAIIQNVTYLPLAIARRAIEKNDHYLFQEFIGFAEYLYIFAIRENDKDIKSLLIDRSWRHLKEISDIFVEAKMRSGVLETEELESLRDYGIYFYKIFQNLLKRAFDNEDFDSFEKFLHATQKLFDFYTPSKSAQNAETLKWQIERLELTAGEKVKLENLLEKQSQLEDIEKEIEIRRGQMYFGLASWILDQFLQNKSDEKIGQFYNAIQSVFPTSIEEFTDLFLNTHSYDVEEFWDWTRWELTTEGEFVFIPILRKLERFYAIKALILIANKADEEIQKVALPYNRDLAYLAEGSRDLINILDDIKTNPDEWKFVLSDNAINKVDLFKDLLSNAKEAQEKEERQSIREQNISQEKVRLFKKGVIHGFYETVDLRKILGFYKLLDMHLKPLAIEKTTRFGINIVEDKAVFFEDWHVQFGDWGRHFGRTLANGENSLLLDEITKDCRAISNEDFEATLSRIKNSEEIVIIATNVSFWRFIDGSKNFKPEWHKDVEPLDVVCFAGRYDFNNQSMPVFQLHHPNMEELVFILNRNKIGRLSQLSPLNKGEKENLVKDIFYMNVQDFSKKPELLDDFLNNPPKWLQEFGDQQKQREHLLERVLVHIYERIEFNKPKEFEGYKIIVKSD